MTPVCDAGWLAALAIAVPLAAVAGILLAHRRPNLRECASLAAGVLLFCVVGAVAADLDAGRPVTMVLAEPVRGLAIEIAVEPLGMVFALLASGLWIVTTVYAIGYMRGHHETNQTRFYAFFAVAISSAIGVAFAGNMLTLFIFYEALTLSTFPLVTHAGTPEARRAGRTYLGILLGTSIGLQLIAIVGTWLAAGTLDFVPGGILEGRVTDTVAGILLALYVFGVGKAALMPFHRWLPAAMVAPTPVSALLHAVAVVKAGVFTILKVSWFIFGFDLLRDLSMTGALQGVAAFTLLAASVIALTRDSLKARLAYSTIAQLAAIVLAALQAEQIGLIGGGLHVVTHAFGKITLFFCAGAILVAAHRTEVSELDGLGRAMPFTMAAFLLASLSVIGLPPFGGLWSKWLLAEGALMGEQLHLVAVMGLSTLLTMSYLMPIPLRAFLKAPPEGAPAGIREAPTACLVAIGVTTLGCFVLFLFPDPVVALLERMFTTPGVP